MRSYRGSMFNLSDGAVVKRHSPQRRLLRLRSLDEESGRLLRAFIQHIPDGSLLLPKGEILTAVMDGNTYFLSIDHDIIFNSKKDTRISVIELITHTHDAMHYRYLGYLAIDGLHAKYEASIVAPEMYFIDFNCELPRSPFFKSLFFNFLASHPRVATSYSGNTMGRVVFDGRDYQLNIKNKGVFEVRLSTSEKHQGELCVALFGNHVASGAYGSVYKTSTYHFIKNNLQKAKHARVIKVIKPFKAESMSDFKAHVEREATYAAMMGLKPKPVLFNEAKREAYLTEREAPGVTFVSYLKENGYVVNVDMAYRISIACLKALAVLHKQGLIHGDIHGRNLMIHVEDEAVVQACFIDPGKASLVENPAKYEENSLYACPESVPSMVGKAGYVGVHSQAADVYILGVLLAKSLWGFSYDNNPDNAGRYHLLGAPSRVEGVNEPEVEALRLFYKGLLATDPASRLKADEAARQLHGYFNNRERSSTLSRSSSPKRPGLK